MKHIWEQILEQPQVVHLLPSLTSSVCSAFPCSPVPFLSLSSFPLEFFPQIPPLLVQLSPSLEGEAQGTCLFPCRALCTVSLRMGDASIFALLSEKNLWQVMGAQQTQSQYSQDVMALSGIPAFPALFSYYYAICRLSGSAALMALAP